MLLEAYTVKGLTRNTGIVDWSKEKENWEHLKDIPFDPLPSGEQLKLLIGLNYSHLFKVIAGTEKEGAKGEPYAYRTELGWTCVGPTTKPTSEEEDVVYHNIMDRIPQ
jgi:hypothetical protein